MLTELGISTRDEQPKAVVTPFLDRLYDCDVKCSDGTILRANTFALVSSCSVLAMFFEDMSDDDTKTFYVDVPSETMRTVIGLVHGSLPSNQLKSAEQVASILHTMNYLGCTTKWRKLTHRLWTLVRSECPAVAGPVLLVNAPLLLPEFGAGFLLKLRIVFPNWRDFSKLFNHITVTPGVAVMVVDQTAQFFPVGLLVHALIGHTPDQHKRLVAERIFSIRRVGNMFHPEEFNWTLDQIPNSLIPLLECARDAHAVVNRPVPLSKIKSSMVTYPVKNTASFFFAFDCPCTKRTCVAFQNNVASFVFERRERAPTSTREESTPISLDIKIDMDKLGNEVASIAPMVYMRCTTSNHDATTVDDQWTNVTVDQMGSVLTSYDLHVSNDDLAWVKVDMYWMMDPRIV